MFTHSVPDMNDPSVGERYEAVVHEHMLQQQTPAYARGPLGHVTVVAPRDSLGPVAPKSRPASPASSAVYPIQDGSDGSSRGSVNSLQNNLLVGVRPTSLPAP